MFRYSWDSRNLLIFMYICSSVNTSRLSLKGKVKLLGHVLLFATPWTVAYQVLHPWGLPGKSTEVGRHFLLQGIFPTQGSNPGLLHCRQTLYRLSHQGSLTGTQDGAKRTPHDPVELGSGVPGEGQTEIPAPTGLSNSHPGDQFSRIAVRHLRSTRHKGFSHGSGDVQFFADTTPSEASA